MIAALAIAGGISTVLALAAIIVLALALRSTTPDVLAAAAEAKLATQARFVAEAARDGYKAQADACQVEAKTLRDQLAATQAAANAARKELIDRVQKEIVSGTPGDAAALVDQLLAQPLSGAGDSKGSATADHGDSAALAVQPAPAANTGSPGRGSCRRQHRRDEERSRGPRALPRRRARVDRSRSNVSRDQTLTKDQAMPHYKDGTEAKLLDVIKGKPYNTPHEVVGVVVGITPSAESCNLRVMFVTREDPGGGQSAPVPVSKIDYGETKAFEKVY